MDQTEWIWLMVAATGKRSMCDMNAGGAVIVRDGRIIAYGHAVTLPGQGCAIHGHDITTVRVLLADPAGMGGKAHHNVQRCVRPVHAHMAALLDAATGGVGVRGASMYCTNMPCPTCANALALAGIRAVFAMHDQPEMNTEQSVGVMHLANMTVGIVDTPNEYPDDPNNTGTADGANKQD